MKTNLAILLCCFALPSAAQTKQTNLQYFTSYEYSSATKSQFLGVGVRAKFKYLTFELSNGIKRANRTARNANKPSNGTQLGIHIHPFPHDTAYKGLRISGFHLSDIFRGKPFNEREEPVDHFLGAGYTFKKHNYEFDLLVGMESHDCSLDEGCDYRTQFKTTLRYIF